MIHSGLTALFAALVAGALIYCVLALRAVADYKRERHQPAPDMPFISVLIPLAGAEEGLRENLTSFFQQDYPEFELLFAAASPDDPAVAVAREVMAEFPFTHSRLLVSGESTTPNRKVHNLAAMMEHARYPSLVMADSDVRTGPDLLRVVSAEMRSPGVALVTCPYRASSGASIWTALEAMGLNTEFLAQVLVARMVGKMDFALGPTLAIRRETLEAIGGFEELRQYLAEDFAMGNRVARGGGVVTLSSFVVEHRLGAQSLWANFGHRLRWARSTRRSRPWGYAGQVFTNPLPLALLLTLLAPRAWPALIAALALRAAVAAATSQRVLRDPLTRDLWWLLPLQDFASCFIWICGFFGSSITWRGRRLHILRDGRFSKPDPESKLS